jgi:hypothetical protein
MRSTPGGNMKKRYICLFMLLLTYITTGHSVTLPGHVNPGQVIVDSDRLYILELPTIFIYSLKDFTLTKRITLKGIDISSPDPFDVSLDIQAGYMMLSSIDKVYLFKKDGAAVREMKVITGSHFKLLGKKFLGLGTTFEGMIGFNTLNIYNWKLVKEKEVWRKPSIYQDGLGDGELRLFSLSPPAYLFTDNKIFSSGGQKDFRIDVFDENGEQLFSITAEYQRVKFTKEDGKKVLQYFRDNPRTQLLFDIFKRIIKFPVHFPAVRDIFADHQTLYVRTFRIDQGKTEFFIFSTEGRFLKKVFLPIQQRHSTDVFPYLEDSEPFTIKDGKLYRLLKNKETKAYELHVTGVE